MCAAVNVSHARRLTVHGQARLFADIDLDNASYSPFDGKTRLGPAYSVSTD